jgi:MraZ protein
MAKPAKNCATPALIGALPYLGQHLRGVDHGRIILPTEWRMPGSSRDFMVTVWPLTTPEYLLVLPPSRWEVIQRNLESLSLTDDQAAIVERLISSNTFKRSIDSYGRLPLPEEPAKRLGIEGEAMLVGRMNKFEVWNPSRFAAVLANPDTQRIAEAIKSIKI